MSDSTKWLRYSSDSAATNNVDAGIDTYSVFDSYAGIADSIPLNYVWTNNFVVCKHNESTRVIFVVQQNIAPSAPTNPSILICYDKDINKAIWKINSTDLSGGLHGSLTLSNDGATLYTHGNNTLVGAGGYVNPSYAYSSKTINAINTLDGSIKWTYDLQIASEPFNNYFINSTININSYGDLNFLVINLSFIPSFRVIVKDFSTYAALAYVNLSELMFVADAVAHKYSIISNYSNMIYYFATYRSGTYVLQVSTCNSSNGSGGSYGYVTTIPSGGVITPHFVGGAILKTIGGVDYAYITTNFGLHKINLFNKTEVWRYSDGINDSISHPSLNGTTIYYKRLTKLFAVTDNGDTCVEKWTYSSLPDDSSYHYVSPIIGNGDIYCFSTKVSGPNVFILVDNGSSASLKTDSFRVGDIGSRIVTPNNIGGAEARQMISVLGGDGLLYVPTESASDPKSFKLFSVGLPIIDTSSTSSSSSSSSSEEYSTSSSSQSGDSHSSGSSSSSSSIDSSSSSSSFVETTTATTTLPLRPPSLARVETVIFSREDTNVITATGNDGSSNKGTTNTINSQSLSFGTLAPGEISKTIIVGLRVPYAKTIDNIKICLVDNGGIEFANNIFGVEIRNYIDYNVVCSTFFQGLNEDNDPYNVNNIDVENKDNISSQYVYLNVAVPENQKTGNGVIRIKWYFDWS